MRHSWNAYKPASSRFSAAGSLQESRQSFGPAITDGQKGLHPSITNKGVLDDC
jgi:hypothetical protein